MTNLAILASGTGTNAEQLAKYFQDDKKIQIAIIITNKKDAGVLEVAKKHHLPSLVVSTRSIKDGGLLRTLKILNIDYVVLAGFLQLIPKEVTDAYPGRIINMHPALLPKYGGKGMYGMHVHNAVSESGDEETGITIHYVNENYDEGDIIAQFKTAIEPHEDPESIRQKVQVLEHEHYPRVVEEIVRQGPQD
jgi:phosphoribosylglycinamide formyltransferase-1